MIRQVEDLAAKLERLPLGDPEVFQNGHIQVDDARTNDGISPSIAVSERRLESERRGIEPAVDRLVSAPQLRVDAGRIRARRRAHADIRNIPSGAGTGGRAGFHGYDSADL